MQGTQSIQQSMWLQAETTLDTTYEQKSANREVEMAYHKALQRLKALYNGNDSRIYERNHKTNRSSQVCAIHDFRTDDFSWSLLCDQQCNYKISYRLFDGDSKRKIKAIISSVKPQAAIEESMIPITLESILEQFKGEAAFLISIG